MSVNHKDISYQDHPERLPFLDSTRGFTVLLMVLVNFLAPFAVVPSWSKHAVGDGFTYVDMIAPMFVFIMGLSGDLSFRKRRKTRGIAKTVVHYFIRYGLLFLFGMAGTAVLWLTDKKIEWVIFQSLAVAGAVMFPFLFVKSHIRRMALSLGMMAVYQVAFGWLLRPIVFSGSGGEGVFLRSFVQSLALSCLAVFGSGLSKWIRDGKTLTVAPVLSGLFLAAAMALSPFIPPNRELGSVTYLFFGLGLGCLFLSVFRLIEEKLGCKKIPVLDVLGKNALLAFMLAGVAAKVLYLLLPEESGWLPILAGAFAIEAFCFVVVKILDLFHITVKL
ncbi:MAG: DUF1624 domain-containing protein [Spirochaetales bacterium]|nr:DUF1624 domain-containing protein [Spirochaetales bacterium]